MNNRYPGAIWWKFDFHTHTPASLDTSAWQKARGTADEMTPEKWLIKYMEAEIDCVAITDHNTGEWVDQLKAAYAKMADMQPPPLGFRELHLFPGVEISVQSGIHLLAIFGPNASTSDIDKLLGRVGYDDTPGDTDGTTRKGLAEVVQAVLDSGAIPIPAHADRGKGLLKLKDGSVNQAELDHNTLKQVFDTAGMLAVEVVDRSIPKPDSYLKAKLNWAEVLGSDCHSFRGEAIPGSRYTWVKMATPALEGLRLALLDGQGISIRRSDDREPFFPAKLPEHFVESIEISNANCMGRGAKPAVFRFSPYFNALIGGRGTGKSTVMHALRLTYRREAEVEKGSEAGDTFADFNQVSTQRNGKGGMRSDTQMTLTVNRDGIPHRLLWRADGAGVAVEERSGAGAGWVQSDNQAIAAQRFPVRLFSQGQIAALAGDNQQALLGLIDDAAETNHAKAAFEDAKRSFFATKAKQRDLFGKLAGRDAVNQGLQDVRRKLQRFEDGHHADVLKAYQHSSRQRRELDVRFVAAAGLVNALNMSAPALRADDVPDGMFDPQDDGEALQAVQALTHAIAQAKEQVEAAAIALNEHIINLLSGLNGSAWQARATQATAAYERLKADLQVQGVNDPSEYGRLVQERQRLDLEAKHMDALQVEVDGLQNQANTQWAKILQARRAISEMRASFLATALAGNSFVRINLLPFSASVDDMERSLRAILDLVSDSFARDIYRIENGSQEGVIADIDAATATDKADAIFKMKGMLDEACSGQGDLSAKFKTRLQTSLGTKPEFLDHVWCWFPEDGLQVEYSRKGDGKDFQPIGQGSAGQRAAAMLSFLLAHGDEPMILDQPEDDLDNHLIYELVVQQIRTNKQRRQLIIVTHNPNIVVNGDAEMIHALDYNNQCFVKLSGSLQDKDMRDEICKVMEGGKDAFERRYQRLGRKF